MFGLESHIPFSSFRLLALPVSLLLLISPGCRSQLPDQSTAPPAETLATNTAVNLPDLLVSNIQILDQGAGPCPSYSGMNNFEVLVTNQGKANADPFTLRFDRQYHIVTQGLSAGASITLVFSENSLRPGVEVDSRNDVFESDETNNFIRLEFAAPTPAARCLRTPTPVVDSVPPLAVMEGHTARVLSVEFSPDSKMIASGSVDNSLRLWRNGEFSLLRTMLGHPFPILDLDFSPDGNLLVTGSTDGILRVWRVSNGQLIKNMVDHAGKITSLDMSNDGKFLVSSAQDFTVRVWRTADFRLVQTIDEGMSLVNQAVFSPDSSRMAWVEDDGTVRVRTLDGIWVYIFHPGVGKASSVAFSPDGNRLAAGFEIGTILIWQMSDGELVDSIEAHGSQISQIDFSPDGYWLAAGSLDGLVSLWEKTESDSPYLIKLIYEGHQGAVNGIAFSPDGLLISSAGDDGTVRIWSVPSR